MATIQEMSLGCLPVSPYAMPIARKRPLFSQVLGEEGWGDESGGLLAGGPIDIPIREHIQLVVVDAVAAFAPAPVGADVAAVETKKH